MGNAWMQPAALESVVQGMQRIAVAVSGGVDSLTLATFAHRLAPARVEMFHAVSRATPGVSLARDDRLRFSRPRSRPATCGTGVIA